MCFMPVCDPVCSWIYGHNKYENICNTYFPYVPSSEETDSGCTCAHHWIRSGSGRKGRGGGGVFKPFLLKVKTQLSLKTDSCKNWSGHVLYLTTVIPELLRGNFGDKVRVYRESG